MAAQVIKGHTCDSLTPTKLRICENSFLVFEDNRILGVYPQLPVAYRNLPVQDYGDRLIIPGMSDLHVHAPQFAFRGLGMDMELFDWLNTHAFPEEAKYSDLSYAEKAYEMFTAHMRRSTTTRAAVFATIHAPATALLMQQLESSGLCTYVGKVNMNRNSPDYLCERSVEEALNITERWIVETKEKFPHTKPILTPRFIPSCTDELLRGLRGLCERYHLPVQSHLSENLGEIAWVQQAYPASRFYGEAYAQFGLFGGDHRCIMAHCVHSSDAELELMLHNGVFIAHSPESNMNIASGVAPISRYMELGLRVGLATDVAGGSSESMLKAMMHAIQASKLRWRLQDQRVKPLTFEQTFYLATVGGGEFFGKVGAFREGWEADFVVLDDSSLAHPQPLSLPERLERMVYLADERHVYAKCVAGRKLF